MSSPVLIELTEYVPATFPRDEISESAGEILWRDYGSQVTIEFPSPKTGGKWKLTSQGWVGYIPLSPDLAIALQPKVKLDNLFGMLEYAYRLKSFQFLKGVVDCRSLDEFYERLANVLARRILERGRKGFYRAYWPATDQLPYVRGRLDLSQAIRAPWDARLQCHYEEHTPDIAENQVLAWTLWSIARSGRCSERVLPTVRRAYRALQGLVTLEPQSPSACLGLQYNRLCEDYRPLHALCRFFLEHSGPSHKIGDRTMLPFLVDMERLYELFVAEWLKAHLPAGTDLKSQERVNIGDQGTHFDIDLVLYNINADAPRCVLDTKYRTPPTPAPDDIAQVVAYAEAKGCREAVLVYPTMLSKPLDSNVGDIRVRSSTFSIEGDLEQGGQAFLRMLKV